MLGLEAEPCKKTNSLILSCWFPELISLLIIKISIKAKVGSFKVCFCFVLSWILVLNPCLLYDIGRHSIVADTAFPIWGHFIISPVNISLPAPPHPPHPTPSCIVSHLLLWALSASIKHKKDKISLKGLGSTGFFKLLCKYVNQLGSLEKCRFQNQQQRFTSGQSWK